MSWRAAAERKKSLSEIIKLRQRTKIRVNRASSIQQVPTEVPVSPEKEFKPEEAIQPLPDFVPVTAVDGGKTKTQMLEDEYQRGFADGFHQSEATHRREIETSIAKEALRVDDFLNKASEQLSILYGSSEQAVLRFALGVAERIIRREVNTDRNILLHHIRDGVQRILGVERVKIRVHPSDLPAVRNQRSEIQANGDAIREIVVEADEQLLPGDCILESDMGNVDARISTQLKQIENALFDSKVIA